MSLLLAFATVHARVALTVSVVTGSSRIVQRNVAADVGVFRALGVVETAVAVAELPGVELLPAAPAAD